jgi:hypothetical protein
MLRLLLSLLLLGACQRGAAQHDAAAAASDAAALVRDFDAASLVGALANHTIVVTFHTRWRVQQPSRGAGERASPCAEHLTRMRVVFLPVRTGVACAAPRRRSLSASPPRSTGSWTPAGTRSRSAGAPLAEAPTHRTARKAPPAPCSSHAAPAYAAARSVDVDAHRPVAKSFGVRNVPFITLLRHGAWFTWDEEEGEPLPKHATRYDGVLAAASIAHWLNNRRVRACVACVTSYARVCHVSRSERRSCARLVRAQHRAGGAVAAGGGGADARHAARRGAGRRGGRAGRVLRSQAR